MFYNKVLWLVSYMVICWESCISMTKFLMLVLQDKPQHLIECITINRGLPPTPCPTLTLSLLEYPQCLMVTLEPKCAGDILLGFIYLFNMVIVRDQSYIHDRQHQGLLSSALINRMMCSLNDLNSRENETNAHSLFV